MGGKGSPPPPEAVDPGASMGEYLFGKDFGSAQGITDPKLQERLLGAEQRYRPEYAALELADIGTYARGIPGGKDNPAYKRLEAQLAGLEAGEGGVNNEQAMKIAQSTVGEPPSQTITQETRRGSIEVPNPDYEKQLQEYNNEVQQIADSLGGNRESQIASIREQMTQLEGQKGQAGLFDLLEEQSRMAGDLQREQLGLQRADDVSALQEFAPQVVEAYRAADPESTRLAEMASARAGQGTGLGARGEELLASQVQAASAAERQLQEMGMTLGDLSPTEQEALISGRGTEFIQSTGELSPLEKRRAQQSSRQASLARGREMGQGSFYDEMLARQAEELNKQERQVALGSQLIGQGAEMRGTRLGQGAGMLEGSEALAAQRRLEQLQRMELGGKFIGQEEGIQTGRFGQAFDMNRNLAGDIGNTILGRTSSAINLGSQSLQSARENAAAQAGPNLFDANAGYNAALQQRGQDISYQGAQAQAGASRSSGIMGLFGALGGGFLAGRG